MSKISGGEKILLITLLLTLSGIVLILVFKVVNGLFVLDFSSSNSTVFIKDSVINELNNEYKESDVERAFCIWGYQNDGNYYITEVKEPTVFNATTENITFDAKTCFISNQKGKSDLGVIHFHIQWYKHIFNDMCSPSKRDYLVAGELFEKYNYKISIIQCGINEFFIFDKSSVYKSLRWQAYT